MSLSGHSNAALQIRSLRYILFVSLLVLVLSKPSVAKEEEFTIQAGTYSTMPRAERNYGVLLNALPPADSHALRVEFLQGFFALRIGIFKKRVDAEQLLGSMRNTFPDAIVIQSPILEELVKKIYPGGESPIKGASGPETIKKVQAGVPSRSTPLPGAPKEVDRIATGDIKITDQPMNADQFFYGGEKQIGLIRARIKSRKGYYEKALHLYEKLRQEYPDDDEIWEDHIETLVNNGQYEKAMEEIGKLLEKNPSNLRGRRIAARIYRELQQNHWAFPFYESILRERNSDAGIWSDYAYARQDTGDWSLALNYFCRVLEIDPENEDALRSIHDILRERRPRARTGYRSYRLIEQDAIIDTYAIGYKRHITSKSSFDLQYDRINIETPPQAGLPGIDQEVRDLTFLLRHRLSQRWEGNLGGGVYSGLGGGTSLFLGLGYRILELGRLNATYVTGRPWYDPVEAADFDGKFDRANLSFDWRFDQAWALFMEATQWDYSILDGIDYGQRRTYSAILSRRFSARPEFVVSYSYYRSRFNYDKPFFTPIFLLQAEGIHSLSFNFEQRPCTYWSYGLSGGVRRDHIREINSWFILPEIKVRLGNRIELNANYEYSSESGSVTGGATETLNIFLNIIL